MPESNRTSSGDRERWTIDFSSVAKQTRGVTADFSMIRGARPSHRVAANVQTGPDVSIVIPVFNKLAFTRQCLDRIWRNTSDDVPYEVIVVDNGSADGTRERFKTEVVSPRLRYH